MTNQFIRAMRFESYTITQHRFFNRPFFIIAVLLVLIALCMPSLIRAESSVVEFPTPHEVTQNCIREQDEIWLLDTHGLSCNATPDQLRVYRWTDRWEERSDGKFWETSLPLTTIYVHGNRTDRWKAMHRGKLLYTNILNRPERAPIRFVIWNWPAERIKGQLRDVREKALRADGQALILARTLEKMSREKQISLIGYSYGARVISGAIHRLNQATMERGPIRAAFLAGAMDRNWLLRNARHGRTLDRLESLLVLYNPCDPALQRFHFVDRCRSAVAIGYRGLNHGSDRTQVEQHNVAHLIGKSHEEVRYYHAKSMFDTIGTFLLWER